MPMRMITAILVFSCLAGCGGRYGRNLPEDRSDYVAWIQANASLNRVGPEIQRLDVLVGVWTYTETLTPWPGAEPEISHGRMTFAREYGGRWITARITDDGNPNDAIATMLLGYSVPQRRYITAEFGAFSTAPLVGEGVEASGRSGTFGIDFEMSMPDPIEHDRRILVRRRIELQPDGHVLITDYRSGWNGTLVPFSTCRLVRCKLPPA